MRKTNRSLLVLLALPFLLLGTPAGLAQTSDTTPPADLEEAPTVVSSGNGQVTLQWEPASDNVGTTGYKLYYGTTSLAEQQNSNSSDRKEYDTFKKVDNVTQATIDGLTNGTKYYFALTALDAAGNESEYFSPESSATPQTGGSPTTGSSSGSGNSNTGNANSALPAANTNSTVDNANSSTGNPTTGSNTAEVSDFTVTENNNTLNFSWKPNSSSAVIDQMLYTSKDNGTTYDSGRHLGTSSSYTMTSYLPTTSYAFKLVTRDQNGSESKGVTTTITTSASNSLPTAQDITNLVAKFERVASTYNVTLTWNLPQNVQNIVSQVVYKSLDGNVFSQIASLAPSVTTYEIKNLVGGKYFFKITTKDATGKESAGVIKMVELPKSGPAALAAFGIMSLFGAGYILRRKEKVK